VAIPTWVPSSAPAQSEPYIDWPSLLPPLPPGPFRNTTRTECTDGDPRCIEDTIREMKRRLNADVPVCDHRAVFSLAYLRVTEDVRNAINAGEFKDPHWLGHEDRVFGRLYFDAYDNWEAGRIDKVPIAWRIAFEAAKRKEVTGLGNFLLSMNAHINRDFPYMLEGIGIVAPDGTSRKPDHDKYNRHLAALYQPVLAEVTQRFDPAADDFELGPADDEFAYFILQSWREGVWRNAERLVNASSPEEHAQVAESIEQESQIIGETIRAMFPASPEQVAARDAWCAGHGGQDPVAWSPAAATLALIRGLVPVGHDGRARVRLRCPSPSLGCQGRIGLYAGRRRLGSSQYALGAGAAKTLRVRLSRVRGPGTIIVRLTRDGVKNAPGLVSRTARLHRR
jgi:hypothetical protein